MAFDVAELHLPITPKRAPAKPRRRNVLNTEYRYIIDDRVDNTIDYGIVTTATHYKMALKYVSSYLLAVAAGNENPSVDDLKKILDAVGSDVDEECLQGLVDSMSGKTVHETIAAGMTKLQSMPAGGAAMPAAAAGGAPAAAEDKAEAKKPEAEPEEEEDDMGFSLFD